MVWHIRRTARARARGLLTLTACALMASTPACSSDTTGTLCGVSIEDMILQALIIDFNGEILVELAFKRAPLEGETIQDLDPQYLCEGDAVTINQTHARPLERAQGQPVYSTTQDRASVQYAIVLESDNSFYTFDVTVGRQELELLSPAEWGEPHSRAEAMEITWTPDASDAAPIGVDILDEIDGISCLAGFKTLFAKSGNTLVVEPGTITLEDGVELDARCPAVVRVTRNAAVDIEARASNSATLFDAGASAFVIRDLLIESIP